MLDRLVTNRAMASPRGRRAGDLVQDAHPTRTSETFMSPYDQDLPQNPANHAPLTPLAFIQRAAEVYPDRLAVVHGDLRRTWGQTMIVNPWGKLLAERANDAGVVTANCDWEMMQEMRQQLPALGHRRL